MAEAAVIDGQPDRVLEPDEISRDLWESWLATTNPHPQALLAGVRAMLEEVYWGPLRSTDFTTWGTKEVAATPGQVDLLRAVFPDAKFVCVVRSPTDAYRSFRRFVVSGVSTRPGPASRLTWVKGPIGYARVWNRLARTLRELAGQPNVLVVRYEDISENERFPSQLADFLDMELDRQAWDARIGSVAAYLEDGPGLAERVELAILRAITRREARTWKLHDRRVRD